MRHVKDEGAFYGTRIRPNGKGAHMCELGCSYMRPVLWCLDIEAQILPIVFTNHKKYDKSINLGIISTPKDVGHLKYQGINPSGLLRYQGITPRDF